MSDHVYSNETGDFIGVVRLIIYKVDTGSKYVAIPVNGLQPKLFDYHNQAVKWLTQHYNLCHM